MSKQDRQGVRTPADIERKYDLARLNQVGQGGGSMSDEQLSTFRQEVQQYMAITNGRIEGKANEGGWTPYVYLGTDENGNMVEKTVPTIDVSKENGITTLTVTDDKGVETVEIADGGQGEKGDKGDPYTLTDEDLSTIIDAVLDAFPSGDEVEY